MKFVDQRVNNKPKPAIISSLANQTKMQGGSTGRSVTIGNIKQNLAKHPPSGEIPSQGTKPSSSILSKDTVRMKVLLLGDAGCGKSSLMNKICYGKFSTEYKPTIKADFGTKKVEQQYFVVAVDCLNYPVQYVRCEWTPRIRGYQTKLLPGSGCHLVAIRLY